MHAVHASAVNRNSSLVRTTEDNTELRPKSHNTDRRVNISNWYSETQWFTVLLQSWQSLSSRLVRMIELPFISYIFTAYLIVQALVPWEFPFLFEDFAS